MTRIPILLVCAVALISCGGGGGGEGVSIKPATTYRATGVGDSWAYSLSIDLVTQGSGTGTLTNVLTADTYSGQASIKDTETFDFHLPSGEKDSIGYSEISPQGALLATSVNGTLYGVASNTFSTGNTINASTSDSGVITLSNGPTLTETYKVLGAEMCDTPAGQFATWIVSQKVVDSTGIIDNFTLWVAPETGTYVKIRDTTTTPIGTAYTYTATLNLISITLPDPSTKSSPLGLGSHLPILRLAGL